MKKSPVDFSIVRRTENEKSPVDFSIARKGGEFVFLRFAIKSFTECLFFIRYAIETASGSFFIFQEKKEIQRGVTIVNRDRFFLSDINFCYAFISLFRRGPGLNICSKNQAYKALPQFFSFCL